MEDNILTINNPKNIPFGPLSNDAYHFMRIDNQRYKTVTNYILANMLQTPIYRMTVASASIKGTTKEKEIRDKLKEEILKREREFGRELTLEEKIDQEKQVVTAFERQKMDIYQLYNYYLFQEHVAILRNAVETAYSAKIDVNPSMVETLQSSGNSYIYYKSGNEFLGTGVSGNGMNLIGIFLMQIRHNIRIQTKEQRSSKKKFSKQDKIYTIYKAYKILRQKIANGDDLSAYFGTKASNIVKRYYKNYPVDKIYTKDGKKTSVAVSKEEIDKRLNLVDKETIIRMYELGNYPQFEDELNNPGYLVLWVRRGEKMGSNFRGGLRDLRKTAQRKRSEKILELYTIYTLEKNYKNKSKRELKEAAKQLLESAPNEEAYRKMMNNAVELYGKGLFSERLEDKIKYELEKLPLPTIEEIESAEKMRLPKLSEEEYEDEIHSVSSVESDNPIKKMLKQVDEGEIKEEEFFEEEEKEPIEIGYIEPSDRPIYILPDVQLNSKNWGVFSPLHEEVFYVNNIPFPNISLYITTKLLTYTGVREVSTITSRLNNFGNLEHPRSPPSKPLVLNKENMVYGTQNKDGTISPLTDEDIKYCEKHGFQYYINEEKSKLIKGNITYDYRRNVPIDLASAREFFLKKDGMYMNVNKANQIYEKFKYNSFRETIIKNCRKALGVKFQDYNLQKLLLLTGNATILWTDQHDLILGTGNKENRGENVVGKTLVEIRTYLKSQETDVIIDLKPDIVAEFIQKDEFMNKWVRMRLFDMCNTVYRMKHYLWTNAEQEEKITGRFVQHVIDIMYNTCSGIQKYQEIKIEFVPDFFLQILNSCKGMRLQFTEDFNQKLEEIKDEMYKANIQFWGTGIKVKEVIIDPLELAEKQTKEYEKAVKKGYSEKDLKRLKKQQRKDFELLTEKWGEKMDIDEFKMILKQGNKISRETLARIQEENPELTTRKIVDKSVFEKGSKKEKTYTEKQREKVQRKIARELKPALSAGEIREKMAKYDKELLEARKDIDIDIVDLERETFLRKKELFEPSKLSEEQQRKIIRKIIEKDQKKYVEKYSKYLRRTAEELKEHEEYLTNLATKKTEIKQKMRKEIAEWKESKLEIAKVYWKYISVLLYFLIQHLENRKQVDIDDLNEQIDAFNMEQMSKKEQREVMEKIEDEIQKRMENIVPGVNSQDIRRAIAMSEVLSSSEMVCKNLLNENLEDEKENCIASALANLLVSIEQFKYQYAENIPFGKEDIKLAGSIILNRDIDVTEKPTIIEEKYEYEEDEFLNDIEHGDESSSVEEFEYGDSGSFGMKEKFNPTLESVKLILQEVTKEDVSSLTSDAQYFIQMIEEINSYKMNPQIKQNRINFFASIK